jgi:hypothetical protein
MQIAENDQPTTACRQGAVASGQVSHVELAADLPVMTIGIFDAAETPSVTLGDWMNCARSSRARLREYRVRIGYGEDHARTDAVERLWAEIPVLRRLIAYPELRVAHGEPRNHSAAAFETIGFPGAEGELVKLDSLDAIAHQEPGRERGGNGDVVRHGPILSPPRKRQ